MKRQRPFDELKLIKLIQEHPAIYDRKSKDYRRPAITENSWISIADELGGAKVEEVKKRWKSIRDAFIKYYRNELTTGKPFGNKKKGWDFYHHLSYLRNNVELLGTRLENTIEPPELYDEARLPNLEDSVSTQQHQQLIGDVLDFDDNTGNTEDIEIVDDTEKIQKLLNEHQAKHEYTRNDKTVELKTIHFDQSPPMSIEVADPDERYLLSCLPVLKRLSAQKNALIKLKIQQLLYEVEFEMNDDSHSSKKSKRIN